MGPVGPTAGCGSASEQTTQLVAIHARIAQDACQSAPLEFAVKRHDERERTVGVLEADVAAALANSDPASLPRATISWSPTRQTPVTSR